MRAMVWTGPNMMNILDKEIPELGPTEVLIKVETVGICGSDLEGYLGHNSLRVPPLQMGHEFAGIIAAVGSEVTNLQVGKRVVVNPLITCGDCLQCKRGSHSLCKTRQIIGIHRPGGYAEYVTAPDSNVYPIEDHLSFETAALTEPLACSLRATRRAMERHDSPHVVVIGAGSIGLLSGFVARILGAGKIYLLDVNEERIATAKKFSFDDVFHSGTPNLIDHLQGLAGNIDVIIDAVGLQSTRELAIKLVEPGGTIMNIGIGIDGTNLPVNHLIRSEIEIKGSFCYSEQDFIDSLQLLTDGRVSEHGWSVIRSLEEGPSSFAELTSGKSGVGKILLHPSDSTGMARKNQGLSGWNCMERSKGTSS
ncbi:galactitol-1-phosphate 5-dehydrogenase [Paenibacillus baekrokdamisoli]|uniref:Galactitol-1-phosphate 5-dehydrogenase n=1 Tax=Paenibacillus baekrokdamisoli TaxID=1712516 RepID=A0A3G9J666_9BACL|nr:galactitol-1-phosphate 5-dehydrogenase [Paenibacillus baekrokdamisoli]MBB3072011.1 threonine dehydrogenase-like Zn-dependent dehydrogenase [Paenibacillus baekrokdamisoli]BBH20313.1 galactitol-1-phosphate 5-dehydrogenase [Paenibacillus baekrokdamisoli]